MEIGEWATASILALASVQLPLLGRRDGIDHLARQLENPKRVLAQDPNPATGNRSHGKFLVAWHAELSHDEDVERSAQRRHLGRDRYPAAWEPEHDDVRPSRKMVQSASKLPARIVAIGEKGGPIGGP
jgi:hypothetical protein